MEGGRDTQKWLHGRYACSAAPSPINLERCRSCKIGGRDEAEPIKREANEAVTESVCMHIERYALQSLQ